MEIKISYSRDSVKDIYKDKLIEAIISKAANFLTLPKLVRIELKKLSPNNYAETDITNKCIVINSELDLNDILFPLVHELIHLEQIELGKLNRSRCGKYVWENQIFNIEESISYSDYKELPWELDVSKRHYDIVVKILQK